MSKRISWPRLIAEGVVIVGSILLAFGIDAWWDAWVDRAQERAILRGLAEDFQGAQAEFERSRELHALISNGAEVLLSLAESGPARPQAARVDSAISVLFAHPTFDPPMGTVETVVNSGRLDLLRNAELVTELTRWVATVNDLREDQERANRHLFETLYPFLAARLNLKELIRTGPSWVQWPGAKVATDAYRLLSDHQFQSIIFEHWSLQGNIAHEGIPPVEVAMDRITGLVNAELGR